MKENGHHANAKTGRTPGARAASIAVVLLLAGLIQLTPATATKSVCDAEAVEAASSVDCKALVDVDPELLCMVVQAISCEGPPTEPCDEGCEPEPIPCLDAPCPLPEDPLCPNDYCILESAEAVASLPPACPGSPIHTGGHPNGSTWIIWVGPVDVTDVEQQQPGATPNVPSVGYYLSWQMGAATLNNGADEYVAGLALEFFQPPHLKTSIGEVKAGPLAQAGCKYIGAGPAGEFSYTVQGGAMGKSGSDTCTWEASISITAGVEFSVFGPSGSAEVTLGASYGCSETTNFDSEVIFGEEGSWPIPSG